MTLNCEIKNLEIQQVEDFRLLEDLFLNYLDDFFKTNTIEDFGVFEKVINECDSLDYQNMPTIIAYSTLHLLDRYRRFQFMQIKLFNTLYLNNMYYFTKKQDKNVVNNFLIRILDVGTGPAPALLAYSDFFNWYREFNKINLCIKGDYIESSESFRRFLHIFIEFGIKYKNKKYYVPFHHGTFFNISEYNNNYNTKYRGRKKYDMAIFSNFLTNEEFIKKNKKYINSILNSMTNKSIVIVVGAKPTNSKKYSQVYSIFEGNGFMEIGVNFKYKNYYGVWKKIFEEDIQLRNQDNETGSLMSDYFTKVKKFFEERKLWEKLPIKTRDYIECGMDSNDSCSWHMRVYRKFSYDINSKR